MAILFHGLWKRYGRDCSSYEGLILTTTPLTMIFASRDMFWNAWHVISRMLNDILILDQQWLPNQSDFPPITWPWYRAWPSPIMSGFHGAFATGVACQQGTLTLPDTWFRPPFWDLLMLQLLRPNSSNLPCLYSTFHLEYPLVLSRFCLGSSIVDTRFLLVNMKPSSLEWNFWSMTIYSNTLHINQTLQ